jgi:UDP-N-acetyl-D-mannosaminuronate dehydrogenase
MNPTWLRRGGSKIHCARAEERGAGDPGVDLSGGATEQMAQWLAEARPDLSFPQQAGEQADINIAYCPERVLPGQVMVELIKNDRVIGGMTPVCSTRASALYKIFLEGECVVTNSRTAEMCKLTENSFRDVNIAFANELSLICADQGINVWELISLANRHPRVNILQPGPAWVVTVSPSTRGLSWRKTRTGASDPYRA